MEEHKEYYLTLYENDLFYDNPVESYGRVMRIIDIDANNGTLPLDLVDAMKKYITEVHYENVRNTGR